MTRIIGLHGATAEVDPNDPQAAIKKLKDLGFAVYVSHKRQTVPQPYVRKYVPPMSSHELKEEGLVPHPKGGATIVTIAHGESAWKGAAYCNDLDNFNRKLGTRIALGRALEKVGS